MELTVRLFADFRKNRFVEERRTYSDTATVTEIVISLGIDPEEVGIVMVDRRKSDMNANLSDGQTLALFPVVGGG